LDVLPPKAGVLIDLAAATLMSRAMLAGLRQPRDAGVTVTIRCGLVSEEQIHRPSPLCLCGYRGIDRQSRRSDSCTERS
jgi:hypothetical protein